MKNGVTKKCSKVIVAVVIAVVTLLPISGYLSNGVVGQVEARAAEIVDSGGCGEHVKWKLDQEGVLTISGYGKMADYAEEESPFCYSSVNRVVITDGVESIGSYAFYYAGLTSISIPDSVTSIGIGAFFWSGLESINIPDSVTSIGGSAFLGCSDLSSIALPTGITFISNNMFTMCSGLTDVTIPDGVTDIGADAFYECSKLSGIMIPDGVTKIGDHAFWGCKNLNNITIPVSISTIGNSAFYYCKGLTDIYYSGSEEDWNNISIFDMRNECLTNAIIHYNSSKSDKEETNVYGISNPRVSSWYSESGSEEFVRSTWDCIWFGSYPQNDTSGKKKEPIKWRVLSVEGDDAFILADQNLDCQPFDIYDGDGFGDVSWKTCTLRSWLNSDFYEAAFTDFEKNAVRTTANTDAFTSDKVYVLSNNEVISKAYGFTETEFTFAGSGREATNTKFTIEKGAFTSTEPLFNGCGIWWLRTGGGSALWVHYDGRIDPTDANDALVAVRPCLHLDLSSSVWSYAGTVCSDGTANEVGKREDDDSSLLVYQGETSYKTKDYGTGVVPLDYDENDFFGDAYKYNHHMARFAATLSTLAYMPDENLSPALKTLDFAELKSEPDETPGKMSGSPYIIAHKYLKEQKTELLLVVVRGTKGNEWVDNFEIGKEEATSRSFESAAEYVYKGICDYIAASEDFHTDADIKILVTGHSRGAAASNIVGSMLDRNGLSRGSISIKVEPKNIFIYTFATPNTTSLPNRFDSVYNNIYNIVNPEDFVTKVVPSSWEFGRYGITYVLPSKTTDGSGGGDLVNYASYLANIQSRCQEYAPAYKYQPYKNGTLPVSMYVKEVSEAVCSTRAYYTRSLKTGIDLGIDVPDSLKNVYKYTLGGALADDATYKAAALANVVLISAGKYGYLGSRTLTYFFVHQIVGMINEVVDPSNVLVSKDFAYAHSPETYLAAMQELTENQLIKPKRLAICGLVNCPVDVTIEDTDGNIVGSIKNNSIDENVQEVDDSIAMDIIGDSKQFIIPNDQSYTITLTGNDSGVMDYTLYEMDPDTGEMMNRVSYEQVPVEAETEFSQTIDVEDELETNLLETSEGFQIEPDVMPEDERIGQLSVNVSVEGTGCADSRYNLSPGDYVVLQAFADENNSFLGWYDKNGTMLSKDEEYDFSIHETVNLTAKFTDVTVEAKTIAFASNSLNLGLGESMYYPATVLPENTTDKGITYESSDESIATVDEAGIVHTVGKGTATVTAITNNGKEAECRVIVGAQSTQFTDVTAEHQFYDPIYWMAGKGITTGWADGTFRPWNICNRAACVTFLWRMAGSPEPKSVAKFKDMPADTSTNHDFRKAISWAVEERITTGWDDNTFRPWKTCNRAAIMTFIWRYAGRPSASKSNFTDPTGNMDFDTAIAWASENGIANGWDDGTFRPWNACNRAAIAAFLYRYEE